MDLPRDEDRHRLKKMLSRCKAHRKHLMETLEESEAEKVDLTRRIDQSETEKKELKTEIVWREAEILYLKTELERSKTQRKELENLMSDMTEKADKSAAEKLNYMTLWRNKLQQEHFRLKEGKALEEKFKSKECEILELKKQLEEIKQEKQKLEDKTAYLEEEIVQGEDLTEGLRKQLNKSEDHKKELHDSLEESEAQNNYLVEKLSSNQDVVEELKNQVEKYKARNIQLEKSIGWLGQSLEESSKKLEQLRQLHGENRKYLDKIERLERMLVDMEAEKDYAEVELNRCETERDDIIAERDELEKRLEICTRDNEDNEQKLSAFEDQYYDLGREIFYLKEELGDSLRENTRLQEMLKISEARKEKIDQDEVVIADLKKQLEHSDAENTKLKEQLHQQESSIDNLKNSRAELEIFFKSEQECHKLILHDTKIANKYLEEMLEKSENEKEKLKLLIQVEETKAAQLKLEVQQFEALTKQYDKLMNGRDQLKLKRESELEAVKKELEMSKAENMAFVKRKEVDIEALRKQTENEVETIMRELETSRAELLAFKTQSEVETEALKKGFEKSEAENKASLEKLAEQHDLDLEQLMGHMDEEITLEQNKVDDLLAKLAEERQKWASEKETLERINAELEHHIEDSKKIKISMEEVDDESGIADDSWLKI